MLQSRAAVFGFHIVGAVLGEVRFHFSCHDKTGFMAMFVCLCAIAFCFALFLNDVSGFILRHSTCVRFAQEPVSRSLSTCILYIFTSILSRSACQKSSCRCHVPAAACLAQLVSDSFCLHLLSPSNPPLVRIISSSIVAKQLVAPASSVPPKPTCLGPHGQVCSYSCRRL